MKLAKSQRRNSSFFKAQTQLSLIAFSCHSEVRSALNRHCSSSGRTGVGDAPFQWGEPGLSGGPPCWSDLGDLVFLGTSLPRGSFCSVSRAASCRKKSARFSYVLREKTMLLRGETTQNDTRVRRKSLRKPVACVYCDLPPRCRARWCLPIEASPKS